MSTRGNILLCGDFNARTGIKCDYVNNDAELPTLPYIIDNGTPRQSSDVTVNALAFWTSVLVCVLEY